MQPTSSETSSEPSPWSRSTRALAVWAGVATLLIVLAFAGAAGAGEEQDRDILFDYEFALGSLLVYGIIVAVTWAAARSFGDARRALGLQRFPTRWIWIALGVSLASLIVSSALEPILPAGEEQGLAPERWQDDRALAFVVNGLVVALVVPFAEELFYRGLGVRVLGFLGKWVAIVGTAVAFALAHGILVGIPALGFFGLALAWVRWQSDSVWPGFVAHAAYNGVGILVAAYAAMNPDKVPGALGFLL